jgi:hypothetical protein
MSLFANLMGLIFKHATPAGASTPAGTAPAATPTATQPAATPSAPPSAPGTAVSTAPAANTPSPSTTAAPVDVGAILDGLAAKNSEQLDWKHSIVDLMKLVGMDSSLGERKKLAEELNYTGDTNDSATMNVWLHKAVMQKLAENGGKVPAGLA